MSWDAYLLDDRGHEEGWWDYTHNTNRMIAAALEASTGDEAPQCDGPLGPAIGPAWWYKLNGLDGVAGHAYLRQIIKGLESDPERFRAMNPPNGWGDYDSLLAVFREMVGKVFDYPVSWYVSG